MSAVVALLAVLSGAPAGEPPAPASAPAAIPPGPCRNAARGSGEFEPADPNIVRLGPATQKVLSVTGVRGVVVQRDDVVEVHALGSSQMLLVGRAEGRSRLRVLRQAGEPIDHTVVVAIRDDCMCICELCKLLDWRDTVRVCKHEDTAYLAGEMSTLAEAERVGKIRALFPTIPVRVRPGADLVRRRLGEIDVALIRAGFPRLTAALDGGRVVLRGRLRPDQDLDKAHRLAAAMFEPLAPYLAE